MGIYKYLIVILVLIFPLSNEVYARPISWSGGSTFMYKTDSMKSSYYYHYSPLYRYSLGVEYVNDRHFNDQYFNLRGTYLLDRENTKSSQRNFYITGGLSTKSSDNFIYGIQGDWETRRVYSAISHTNQHTKTKDFSESEIQLGIAPYLGEYDDLHSWIMVKAKKNTIDNDWNVYPFVKFFKGDFLIELGTKNSHWDIHYMIRF
ncbi:MAG: hypothetical protein VX036_02525 [Pseudomonadota bacterium]|nr:hypothetical protein [Pseudomonadota bacterium]